MTNPPLSDDNVAVIAGAFASRADATVAEVVDLVRRLRDPAPSASTPATAPATAPSPAAAPVPALPPNEAVTGDTIYCLCCGKGFKMLKRHLGAEHGLTEGEYRRLFDLPGDMPLVAPSYSRRKAEHARRAGLGKYERAPAGMSEGDAG